VIDRWIIGENATENRMAKSLKTALQMGDGVVMVQKFGNDFQYFSKNLMDAETGNALPIPEPNTFSFNSPKEVALL
jgi:excinuclease ABC subunit A